MKKMKQKGFTMIEIIISITLVALIGITIAVSLNKQKSTTDANDYTSYVNKVISAADVYLTDNKSTINELESEKGYIKVNVSEISKGGFIDSSLVNPKTGDKVEETKDYVLVSLDEAGTLKLEYNGDASNEAYLEARNVNVEYKGTYNCKNLDDWGTSTLRLINADGSVNTSPASEIITNIECSVDTNKIGTYTTIYTYIVPEKGTTKTATRNVIVNPSSDDIISLSATVTPNVVNINGTISFNVIGKNRKGEDKTLTANLYSISNSATNVEGKFSPVIKYTGTNSDGTTPETKVNYEVRASLPDIIESDPNCKKQSDGSCYYVGDQTGNYVKYSNRIWRIYKKDSDKGIRMILNNTTGQNYSYTSYYQQYYCNPAACCNSGYGLSSSNNYYLLSQNPNGLNSYLLNYAAALNSPSTYLKTVNYDISGYNQGTSLLTQNIGLLNYKEYSIIASCSSFACQSNYLSNSDFGLSTYYSIGVSNGSIDLSANNFNRMVNILSNQSLYVASNGNVQVANGAYQLYSNSLLKANNGGTSLGVKPVVVLNTNVKISSGDGTINNPYIVG